MSIREDEDSFGGSLHSAPTVDFDDLGSFIEPDKRDALERLLMIGWAGVLSEERATGQTHESTEGFGLQAIEHPKADFVLNVGSDVWKIVNLTESVSRSPEEAAAYGEWLRLRTAGILEHPIAWAQVEAVAKALLDREALTGSELAEIRQRIARGDARSSP